MRTDLTSSFSAQTQADGRAPIQLLEFDFPVSGTVRVSDRELGPADGLDNTWSGIVEDWGALEDVVAADPSEVTIEARQMTVSIINKGDRPFSDYFLLEDPERVEATLYQWFDGLTQADVLLLDRFVIADPIRFSERSRLVTLDLVSVVAFYNSTIGELLSSSDFPSAKTDDVGRAIDILFGAAGRVGTLCAKAAPECTLNGSILSGTMILPVHEDLDTRGFSSSGTLQLGEELVRYGSRTSAQFNLIQRGYQQTAPAEHLDRSTIVELITDHTYLVGKGPVASISEVQVGGYPAPAGIYSVQEGVDPARVVFSEKPYAYGFSAASSFLAMQFDAINADNTAFQAYKAYDAGDDATAARIDESERVLSLRQVTVNSDRGAIVKAYLAIEHWESDTITNDYGEVWVEGIGVVGRLSRPSAAEGITVEGEVDIDHGHAHAIGTEHTHYFHDPVLETSEVAHTHTTNTSGTITSHVPQEGASLAFTIMAPYDPGERGDSRIVWFPDAPFSYANCILHFWSGQYGATLEAAGRPVGPTKQEINLGPRIANYALGIEFVAIGAGSYGGNVDIRDISVDVIVDTEIDGAITGANTQVAVGGRSDDTASDKHPEDVDDLSADNASVQVTTQQASTRSHVNLYDLTSAVAFDWEWFSGRDVKVTYKGSADNQSIYILHMFFDVEYRPRERFYSDDVSAEVVGLLDDSSGSITGTANGAITRPDHVARYLLQVCGGFSANRFDTSSYASAGARLAAKSYTIDGGLSGDITVKEAIRKLSYQARVRPFFSGGLSKLRFVERFTEWGRDDGIEGADYQLNSLAIERQPLSTIINRVDLFFDRDRTNTTDGPSAYNRSVRASDTVSANRFGVRADPDRFLFDLVVNEAMASDLASFYAERYSYPSSFVRLNCYLEKIALEKEDKVEVTAGFHKLRKTKARILSAGRSFGSGKNASINRVNLLLEVLRYILIEHQEEDTIRILDALDVSIGKEGEFSEVIDIIDQLTLTVGAALEDRISISDALAVVANYRPLLEETLTFSDALSCHIGVNLEDTLTILDDYEVWRQYGYGGGPYGEIGWGGFVIWRERTPDELFIFDELTIDQVSGPLEDTLTISDELYISSGYGCPVGTGWGLTPWGD